LKNTFIHIILFIIILPTCTTPRPKIIIFDLHRCDYLEAIDALGTIQAVNNNTLITPRIYSNLTIIHLAEEGVYVNKGDTICIISAPDLIKSLESYRSDLEKMEAEMRSLLADNAMQLSLLEAQVETNEARIAISNLDSIQIKFATPVKQRLIALEMEKVSIEKMKLKKKLAARKKIDNSELMQIRSRILMQNNRIQISQNQLNSLKLVSPCNGFVMHCESPKFWGPGGSTVGGKIEEGSIVFTNMQLLQIPDIRQMQVAVEVPENDYKRIKEGQEVLIRVEAAADLLTTGKIQRKTLAGNKTQEESSIKTYEVIISVDSCHLKIKPGLSANCKIIIDQVRDTIVVPAAAIFVRDSLKIVYVASGEYFMPITVETGLSNSSKSIIAKGLSGNETIALMEPPHKLIRKDVKSKEDNTINFDFNKKDSVFK